MSKLERESGSPSKGMQLLREVPDVFLPNNANNLMAHLMDGGKIVYQNPELVATQNTFGLREKSSGFYKVYSRKGGLLNYEVFYAGDSKTKYVDRVEVRDYQVINDFEADREDEPIIVATITLVTEPGLDWCPDGRKKVEKSLLFGSATFSEGSGQLLDRAMLPYDQEAAELVKSACDQIQLLSDQSQVLPAGLRK